MQEKNSPVLCFGIFFSLLLRESVDNLSAKGFESGVQSGMKNRLTEVTAFLELNRIIDSSFSPANTDTFAGQASKFKSCKSTKAKNLPIVNASEIKTFIAKFNDNYAIIFENMLLFVNTYIHPDITKRERLVKSLLELIRDDKNILPDERFYVNGNNNVLSKVKLIEERKFSFVAFLVGIFRYIVEFKSGDNMKGALTYEQWYPSANQALRTPSKDIYVGSTIRGKIVFKEDDVLNLEETMFEKEINRDLSCLTGIDKADYFCNEAKKYRCNQMYDKSLLLYYEAWIIYQDVIGVESRCAKNIFNIMEEVFKQMDKPYSLDHWMKNVADKEVKRIV